MPGLTGAVLFQASEGDEFVIVDGPQTQDAFTWWQVQDPNDSNRTGWAPQDYLTMVP
jgi:hypothetical protein